MCFDRAATAVTFTDLWWIPTESGWGVNVVQQGEVLFLTWFVYAADGSAAWYSATLDKTTLQPNNLNRYDGDLYETRGTFFGGVWNPTLVIARKVGTASLVPANLHLATLSYAVDGVPAVKPIERETFRHIAFGGNYLGGYSIRSSTCSGLAIGRMGSAALVVTAPLNGDGITGNLATSLTLDGTVACALSGTFKQYGSMYDIANGAACSTTLGAVDYDNISASDDGIQGTLSFSGPAGCTARAAFSAVRQ